MIFKLNTFRVCMQIRGVFVMGGVLADATPMTMPSLPNVLNRFSRCRSCFILYCGYWGRIRFFEHAVFDTL